MNKRAKFLDTTPEQKARIEVIRNSFSNMYNVLEANCKSGRETSLAITKLEEAQFWTIKGITREGQK